MSPREIEDRPPCNLCGRRDGKALEATAPDGRDVVVHWACVRRDNRKRGPS